MIDSGAAPEPAGPIAPAGPLPTGYAGIASVALSVANDILRALWDAETIPHEIDQNQTHQLITIAQLRDTCTGVPDDGVLGRAAIAPPPVVSASSVSARHIGVDLTFALPVVGSAPARLEGTFHVDVPLEFQVLADATVRLSLNDSINALQGALSIAPSSTIQPRSPQHLETLRDTFLTAAHDVLVYLFYGLTQPPLLDFRAAISVAPEKFPNSTVAVRQVGAACVRRHGVDALVIGVNVQSPHTVDPDALATQELPAAPETLHVALSDQFATDALSAVVTSGDLKAFINRVIARHVPFINVVDVTVNAGQVAFENGRVRVTLSCVAKDACPLKKDLEFTASISGTPTIANGTLSLATSNVDFDLDNWDAFLCSVLGGIFGPISLVLHIAVLAFVAALNPESRDLDIPVATTSDPLPGTEKVVNIGLTRALAAPGVLTGDGLVRLVADDAHTFVYLRVLRVIEGPPPALTSPLAGVTVDLFELDSPAPAGDDVNIPAVGETEEFTPKFIITTVTSYDPRADELLGSARTDADGNVRFVVIPNASGGTLTETRITETVDTGETVSTVTTTRPIGEAKPDFGITVRTAAGALITRRLVGLNVPDKRLGSRDQPIVVLIQQAPVVFA